MSEAEIEKPSSRRISTPSIATTANEEGEHREQQGKDIDEAPDGGYGWFVVLGSFLLLFTIFGTTISWGVMQDYYEQNVFGETATVQLSLVSNIILLVTVGGSLFSRTIELLFGVRRALIVAAFLYSAGLVAAGSATQIWQLYLALGVCTGCGDAIIYAVPMRVVPQWFTKRRGTAMSIVASATGLGGLVVPFIMNRVNEALGAPWTFRIMGIAFFVLNLSSSLLVKERVRPTTKLTKVSDIFRPKLFKKIEFLLWCGAGMFQIFYLYIPPFFLPSYGTHIGLTPSQGSALVSVFSALNFVGRVVSGIMADRIGALNANMIYTFMVCITGFLVWTFAHTYATVMVCSVLFGFFGGSFYALCGPITAQIMGMELYPFAFTLLMLSNCPALFGATIVSAIERVSSIEPFMTYKLFTGATAALAFILMGILRFRLSPKLIVKV
ncbi:major facilitator superfamily domain-containing protein [Dichotomocladium elegans]|nr:major facilitator superfamily domain-containing protein [Dichotomocladium elegans]